MNKRVNGTGEETACSIKAGKLPFHPIEDYTGTRPLFVNPDWGYGRRVSGGKLNISLVPQSGRVSGEEVPAEKHYRKTFFWQFDDPDEDNL